MTFIRPLVRGLALLSCLVFAACTLPKSAPVAANVEEAPDPVNSDYFVVPLVPQVVQVMGNRREAGFPTAFHLSSYRPTIALKPGDIISVTIYEVGNAPTFGALPSRSNFASDHPRISPTIGNGRFSLSGVRSDTIEQATRPVSRVLIASNDPSVMYLAQGTQQNPPTGGGSTSSPQPAPPTPPSTGTLISRTLPPLIVESDGDVLIPYADRVHVAGLTPTQAAERIRDALADKAISPQVLVSFVSNGNNQATVGGEALRPGPVVLSLRGERLLDAIGQAGGSKWPAPDTDIDIIRGQQRARMNLQAIVENPSENIRVRPNDQIFLTHDPRSFTVLGATLKPAQYTFDTPRVTLAEAVGRAGGAVDAIGNPAAVYLFREDPVRIADKVLAIAAVLKRDEPVTRVAPLDSSRVKLVYRLDMNSAEGYFLARKILMLDKDVVLIANAEGTQLIKAFTIARGVTGAIGDLNIIGRSGVVR